MTNDYYMIDYKNTTLYIDFACSLPCRTCISTNITGCSACFNPFSGNESLTNKPYFSDNYCYE